MTDRRVRGGAVIAAGAVLATMLTACTGNGSDAHLPGTNTNRQRVGDTVTITHRWWSTPLAKRGSVIDPASPTSGAVGLKPSRADYCAVLSQTVHSRRSILAGVPADDPAVQVTTEAFVAETTALAPRKLQGDWKILGSTLDKLAASKGDIASIKGVDPKSTHRAAVEIARDSLAQCHVNLSTSSKTAKKSKKK